MRHRQLSAHETLRLLATLTEAYDHDSNHERALVFFRTTAPNVLVSLRDDGLATITTRRGRPGTGFVETTWDRCYLALAVARGRIARHAQALAAAGESKADEYDRTALRIDAQARRRRIVERRERDQAEAATLRKWAAESRTRAAEWRAAA